MDNWNVLLTSIKDIESILESLDRKMEAFIDEDYKKLKKEVETLKVYRVEQLAANDARKGLITGVLKHWGGIVAILTIIIMGAIELKKMKP
jgi:hypothetical protein